MSVIDKLRGAAAGVSSQIKSAANDTLRQAMLGPLITEKSHKLLEVEKQLAKLGWSPEVNHERAQLTALKAQLTAQIGELKTEAEAYAKADRAKRDAFNRNLR